MLQEPNYTEAEEPTTSGPETVTQALDSDDPEVRASALNATLGLLFRLNGLTQQRRAQEQRDRETALIQLPIEEALRSEDPWIQSRSEGVMRGFLSTLQEVEEKKQRVEQMMAQLQEEIQRTRRARSRKIFQASLLILVALVFCSFRGAGIFSYWWMFFPLSGFWAIDKSRGKAVVQRLSEAWDPRAVGVLAVVAQDRDAQLSHQAQQALLKLLPRVRASDAAYIDVDGMWALIGLLKRDYHDLRLALLLALEQIGDERAIPMVLDLRDSPQIHLEVREAAAECLPALENRVRLAQESATLLRAGSGPAEAASVLLRPAAGAPAATDNLLRPAEEERNASAFQAQTTDPPLFSAKSSSDGVSDDTALRSRSSLT